jgi:16S rRNA (guanine(1405)-N(7))-methyltransferase
MDLLDKLVHSVLESRKYRHVSPALVRAVGARELAVRPRLKEAVKGTKNKLHQVGGAYFETAIDYEQALVDLETATSTSSAQAASTSSVQATSLPETLRQIMALHSSTRERLPILDQFYTTILANLPPIHSLHDLACGLNPLARPWLPLPATACTEPAEVAVYHASDIYADMVEFLNRVMAHLGWPGQATVRDLLTDPPTEPVDLALLLKAVPCLDQLDKEVVPRLLDSLPASYWLISFPVHSLGGRSKGMVETYEGRFVELMNGRSWTYQRFQFETELAFLVTT